MSRKRDHDGAAGVADRAPASAKKRRVYTESDARLAKLYDGLASELKDVQLDSAVDLLKAYHESQSSDKIIVRLARGLCSSRKAARPGFFIALTEILKSARDAGSSPTVFRDSFSVISENTEPERGASKGEKREHLLGRIAGYTALVHSGAIFSIVERRSDGEGDEQSLFATFVSSILDILRKSPILSEQCGKLLVDVVVHAADSNIPSFAEELLRILQESSLLHTSNGLAVWLQALTSSPHINFPRGVWKKNDPFALDELSRLAKVLSGDSSLVDADDEALDEKTNASTRGVPRREPHFVWHLVFRALISKDKVGSARRTGEDAARSGRDWVKAFWGLAVDGPFFETQRSPERKALGFRIFNIAIATVPDDIFAQMLSPQLLRCLVNQQADANRVLHNTANDVIKGLMRRAGSSKHPTTLRDIVVALFRNQRHGEASPARTARINLVIQKLLTAATATAAHHLLPHYENIVCGSENVPGGRSSSGIAVHASQLAALFKAGISDNSNEKYKICCHIVQLLASVAFSAGDEAGSTALPPAQRNLLQTQIWACLRDVLEIVEKDGMIDDGLVDVLESALPVDVEVKMHMDTSAGMIREADGIRAHLKTQIRESTTSPSSSTKSSQAQKSAWYIMFSITELQIYCQESDAPTFLGDLVECYNVCSNRPGEEISEPFDSIVDIVLALGSKPVSIFRLIAELAFSAFAPLISAEGLDPLFHVLSREENIAGQRDLYDQEVEHGDEDSQPDESASDVEIVSEIDDNEAAAEDTNSHSDDEDGSESQDEGDDSKEDDDEDVDSGDEALNASLGEILRTRNVAVQGSADFESDSDSDMTDGAMETLNIDAQLSTIFKQRRQASASSSGKSQRETKKAQQLEAKRLVTIFKSRVLGLLAIYINSQYATPACLSVILPLCQLIGATRNAQLAKKSNDALERYIKLAKKKHGMPVSVDADKAWVMLDELHEEALLYRSKLHATACSRGALFLARVLVEKGRSAEGPKAKKLFDKLVGRLRARYEQTRQRKLELRSELPDTFWENWKVWLDSMGLK